MPYTKIYIHAVWSTYRRVPYLNNVRLRKTIWEHIKQNAKSHGIYVDMVGGYSDHCHCLMGLGNEQTIAKVVQMLKGESSHWINLYGLTKQKFAWQTDYYVASISPAAIPKLREYIKTQESHHANEVFDLELEHFMKSHGMLKRDDDLGLKPQ